MIVVDQIAEALDVALAKLLSSLSDEREGRSGGLSTPMGITFKKIRQDQIIAEYVP
jgi:hypothetical protein